MSFLGVLCASVANEMIFMTCDTLTYNGTEKSFAAWSFKVLPVFYRQIKLNN
jgi:hypothetical protein